MLYLVYILNSGFGFVLFTFRRHTILSIQCWIQVFVNMSAVCLRYAQYELQTTVLFPKYHVAIWE